MPGYLRIPREVARPPAVCTGWWFDRAKSCGIVAAFFVLLVTVVETDVESSWAICNSTN